MYISSAKRWLFCQEGDELTRLVIKLDVNMKKNGTSVSIVFQFNFAIFCYLQ